MRVRPAVEADLEVVEDCARAAFARYVPRIGRTPAPMVADFAAHLAAGELFVAEADHGPVGYIVLRPDGAALRVENLALAAEAQGHGLGRALMRWAEARARAAGCCAVTLYTNAAMTENLAWYPKLGYRQVGRAVQDGFDRVFFRKDFTGGIMQRRGLLIILSSPSGAGKSTLSRRLRDDDPTIAFSVSATTRPPRPGEVEGTDYYFLNRDEFLARVAAGDMLEHAEVFGNLYGSPRAPVEAAIYSGCDVLFDVDWQGGQQIKESALRDQVVSIFLLPPSIAALQSRLVSRGQDSPEVIAGRMRKSRDEISHWAEYDYVLVNDDLDLCEARLKTILAAERLRRTRQPGLMGHVQGLNAEFEEMMP